MQERAARTEQRRVASGASGTISHAAGEGRETRPARADSDGRRVGRRRGIGTALDVGTLQVGRRGRSKNKKKREQIFIITNKIQRNTKNTENTIIHKILKKYSNTKYTRNFENTKNFPKHQT